MKWALALIALAALQCLGVHAATAKGKVAAEVADDYMAQDTLASIKATLQNDLDTVKKNHDTRDKLFDRKMAEVQKQILALNDEIAAGQKEEAKLQAQLKPLQVVAANIQKSIDALNAKLVGEAFDVSASSSSTPSVASLASLVSTSDDLVLLSSSSKVARRADKASVSRRLQRVQDDVKGALLKRFTRMLESLQSIRARNLSPADTGRELEKLLQGSALLEVAKDDDDSGVDAVNIIDTLIRQAIDLFKSANPQKISQKSREKICGDIISQLKTIIDGYNSMAPAAERVSMNSASDAPTAAPGSVVQPNSDGSITVAPIEPATLSPGEEASHESLKAEAESLKEHNEDINAKLSALVQAQHDAIQQQEHLAAVNKELERRAKCLKRLDVRRTHLEEKEKQIAEVQKQLDDVQKEIEHDQETQARLQALGSNLKKFRSESDDTFGEVLDNIQSSINTVGKLDKAIGTNAEIQDYGGFVVEKPKESFSSFNVASVLADSFPDVSSSFDDSDITL